MPSPRPQFPHLLPEETQLIAMIPSCPVIYYSNHGTWIISQSSLLTFFTSGREERDWKECQVLIYQVSHP